MSRYDDIDPQDIDPETGRPYAGYSSPSLDTAFHDGEMDIDDYAIEEDRIGCGWQMVKGQHIVGYFASSVYGKDGAQRMAEQALATVEGAA